MEKLEIKEIYEQIFDDCATGHLDADADIQMQYVLANISHDTNVRVLDAGCGDGNCAEYLWGKGYKKIVAVDLMDEIKAPNIEYICASIDKMPFENESFENIYSLSVIFYLENPESGLKEFYRCLRSGGVLVVSAHTKYSLFTLYRKFKLLVKPDSMKHLQGVKFYSVSEYEKMLTKCGFKVVLKDGYRASWLLSVIKGRLKWLDDALGTHFFDVKFEMTKNKWWALIKAIIAYHCIIVARKD